MRKKHPKTREERRTIDKVKQGEQKLTKPSVETLATYISYSNLSDQVVAFMDYVGLLPENAEIVAAFIGPIKGTDNVPVEIKYTVRG